MLETISVDTAWLESESARLLNPPAVFETFRKQRIEYISEVDDEGDGESRRQFDAVIKQSGLF